MKKFIVLLAIAFVVSLTFSSASYAFGSLITINEGDEIDNSIKNKNTNTNTNRNVNTNTNTNRNVNTNTNTNRNMNTNIQGQMQGQMQGQAQGQGQGQMNNWSQVYEDVRDHVSPNQYQGPNSKMADRPSFDHKTKGSVWSRVDGLSAKQAAKLGKSATDVDIAEAVIFENEFKTTFINKGSKGDFMGYLYATPDGADCNAAAMEGQIAKAAMKLGATHMKLTYAGTGVEAIGDSWNIGLGGGASIIQGSGDTVAIAPNGGLGFGAASASNDKRPAMVFEIYFDKDTVKEKTEKSEIKDGSFKVSSYSPVGQI